MASPPEVVHVWTWLPGHTEPIAVGAIRWRQGVIPEFAYSESYLAGGARFPIAPELPLDQGWKQPAEGLSLHGAFADALPDSWGQDVLRAERPQAFDSSGNEQYVLMANSGTDRFGALDFQLSPDTYTPRVTPATLDELHHAAEMHEAGERLTKSLEDALLHGTSIGGARPKALITDAETGQHWIAKFSSTSDGALPVVNAEAACLDLAARAGITAAKGQVTRSMGKDVLLVERFDRDFDGHRFHTVSALTMAKLDPLAARYYATYPKLYDDLVDAGAHIDSGAELFDRIVFNIAISNSDDHARNHAAFWDGETLNLTPAYDLAPGNRSGETSTQLMGIGRAGEKDSNFVTCINAAEIYGLSKTQAKDSVDRIVTTIEEHWDDAADNARLTGAQKDRLFKRQILNRAASYGYEPKIISVPKGGWQKRTGSSPGASRGVTKPGTNEGSFMPKSNDLPERGLT